VTAEPGTAVGLYLLDRSASRFMVRAFASGMLSAMGHNPTISIRDFTGEAVFDPADMGKASLRIQIRADSLEVTDDISSKDRQEMESMMNEKVLESARYPAIVFESRAASADQLGEGRYRVTLNGHLSLHGVTRSLPVTAQVTVIGGMLRASGEFSILQSNYGIPLVSVAVGTLKLKDELKFTFEIIARKQD
jgi:polyisoprenoid-binding protein YceI